jgi:hypothetical protein
VEHFYRLKVKAIEFQKQGPVPLNKKEEEGKIA